LFILEQDRVKINLINDNDNYKEENVLEGRKRYDNCEIIYNQYTKTVYLIISQTFSKERKNNRNI